MAAAAVVFLGALANLAMMLALARRNGRLRRRLAAADAENDALCALIRRLVAPPPPCGQGRAKTPGNPDEAHRPNTPAVP
jgi:hypothetical protein